MNAQRGQNLYQKAGLLRLAALVVAASGLALGSLIGPRSVADLQQSADLIVVGTAGGFVAPVSADFSLQVSRVVKGDPTLAGSVISVHWSKRASGTAQGGAAITASGSGLWFLQRSSSSWLLIPVVQGDVPLDMTYFPAPAGPVLSGYAYDSAAPLSDKIAAELCSATENLTGSYNFQLYALQSGLLDQLRAPSVGLFYRRMSNASSVPQRILGLSGLIRGGSGAALVAAVEQAAAFEAYPLENGILLLSIRDQFRTTDARSIAALGQAAVSSANPTSFRVAVAHALSAIHTVDTLPHLATLLDDADTNLRIEAIGGIASFANGLPIQTAAGVPALAHLQLPANAPYRTDATMAKFALGRQAITQNEAAYLSFWRQWWQQNRAALGL